ncbi:GIY-YIG nuclease family protein [Patescibacteria group bacterium]
MHYTYILYSKKLNKFYIGSAKNLRKRLQEHNTKKVSFTSRGLPWILVYYSAFIYKEDALSEERFLKSGQGRERKKYLLATFLSKQNNKQNGEMAESG